MSTILDALRRLEQDKQIAKKGVNPLQSVLTDEPAVGEARSQRNLFAWSGAGFIVLILLAVAVTYWVAHRTEPFSPTDREGGRAPAILSSERLPSASTELPAKVPAPVLPDISMEKQPGKPSPAQPLSTEEERRFQVSPSPDRFQRGGDTNVSESESIRSREPSWTRGEELRGGRVVPSEPGAYEPQDITETAALPDPPRRSEPGIKISAIVWSSERKSRFAVVNLKTVHEGDRIGALGIVEIQEDGIVFEEDGETFKSMLGRR